MRHHLTLLILMAGPLACAGNDDDKNDTGADGDADTDADADADADSDADTDVGGFTIDGFALDWATQGAAAEGLCIDLIDPSPALTGGDPALIQSSTVMAAGVFQFADVVTDSTLGLLASVKDCGTENTTVFTSATGIPFEDIDGLGDGDTLAGVTAVSLDMTFVAGMQASAEPLGYTGDMVTDGLMFILVQDSGGTPVSGATVTCATCGPTYYPDADPKDGLFTTGLAPNTATDALAGGTAVIPAGPIGQYTADDGVNYFPVQLNGSNPGSATVTAFIAQ